MLTDGRKIHVYVSTCRYWRVPVYNAFVIFTKKNDNMVHGLWLIENIVDQPSDSLTPAANGSVGEAPSQGVVSCARGRSCVRKWCTDSRESVCPDHAFYKSHNCIKSGKLMLKLKNTVTLEIQLRSSS